MTKAFENILYSYPYDTANLTRLNLTPFFTAYINDMCNRKPNSKKYNAIKRSINHDNLSGIFADCNVFYIERNTAPQYVIDEIKRWCNRVLGLNYLYDGGLQ